MTNKCASVVGHFVDHADQTVWCRAHRPTKNVQVYPRWHWTYPRWHWTYPRRHWTPPSGEYSPCIAPVDTMVIDFGVKNRVVSLWKSLFEASIQMARNRPSTQLVKATSCVERSNATMRVEELKKILAIKHWQRTEIVEVPNHLRSLSKCGTSWQPIAVKLLTTQPHETIEVLVPPHRKEWSQDNTC